MISEKDAMIIAGEKLRSGEMTADQANVYSVQLQGVAVVKKLSSSVRKALNAAVKNKELGHIKKDGLKPEVYHHVNSRSAALEIREECFRASLKSINKIATNS